MSHDDVAIWPGELLSLLDSIETVEALDVLCAVAREPTEMMPFDAITQRTGLNDDDVGRALSHLRRQGILVGTSNRAVRLVTPDAPFNAARLALLRLYDADRELMVRTMIERSIDRVRTSAAQLLVRRRSGDDDSGQ